LVADDGMEPDRLDFAKRPLPTLEVVEGGDDPRLGCPGIRPGVDRLPSLVHAVPVEDLELQPELRGHLVPPLLGDPCRADDEDAGASPSNDQLPQGDPRLDRLAQPDVAGVEQPRAGQREHPQGWNLLVQLEANPRSPRGYQS